MAKQPEDVFTLELNLPRRRGRPSKPDALSDAERARRYRERKKAQAKATAARRPAKYFDAATGQTWSGRGLMPRWIRVALDSGRCTLEQLRVGS